MTLELCPAFCVESVLQDLTKKPGQTLVTCRSVAPSVRALLSPIGAERRWVGARKSAKDSEGVGRRSVRSTEEARCFDPPQTADALVILPRCRAHEGRPEGRHVSLRRPLVALFVAVSALGLSVSAYAGGARTASQGPVKPEGQFVQELLVEINAVRAAHSLRPLRIGPALRRAADQHDRGDGSARLLRA